MSVLRYLSPLSVVSSLSVLSLAVVVGLGGCQQKSSEQVVVEKTTNADDAAKSSDNVDKITSKDASTASGTTPASNGQNSLDNAIIHSSTINYDTPSWDSTEVKRIALSDTTAIRSVFGKPKSTDENSLDFDSHPATKYRYMANDEPYLDIVDSASYFEVDWYYANPNDTDSEKQTSISHAKKAYLLARHLMGSDGGNLVKQMLSGQTVKDKDISGVKVALAKCEFYSCMLVLDKQNGSS